MQIIDIVNCSISFIQGYDTGIEMAEKKYDIDISEQQIIEYFNVMRYIDNNYYNNINMILINSLEAISLNKDFIQILTTDIAVATSLRKSFTKLGVEAIRSTGKEIIVHIIKQWIDRIFADMRYDLSVNRELIQNPSLQNYLITLNHIIRVKIKKYIQMDADFCEQLAKSV
ncbi:MAG: hypothetical protein IJA79_05655 [Desulfovibrio sp.]|nr:hypothetical protein [Desulfovibrio sp.]